MTIKTDSGPFKIGDTATLKGTTGPVYDGTVVDLFDDIVRVYWRYPLGKVEDYRISSLLRVV